MTEIDGTAWITYVRAVLKMKDRAIQTKGSANDVVTPAGILILGGILDSQAESVIQAAAKVGLNLTDTLTEQDWVVLVFQKNIN